MATRMILVCQGVCLFLFCAHSIRSEDNISVGKTAAQSSDLTGKWKADAAVDGCVDQDLQGSDCCSHTQDVGYKEAWWRVNLGTTSTISYITIYYRGCPIKQHGNGSCNQTCSDKCYGGNCDASTGSCFYCTLGNYGPSCEFNCSEHCNNSVCMQTNGQCKDCTPGNYGPFCELNCSEHCNNSVCMQTSGQCKECVAGKYGPTCEQNCPPGCNDNVRSINEGKCLSKTKRKRQYPRTMRSRPSLYTSSKRKGRNSKHL